MSPRVLVVDDEDAIRALVAAALRARQYEVHTAANGREALNVVAEWLPQFVLLDVNMPVLDGYGFARGLCELGIKLRICIMTATPDPAGAAAEIGAEAYLRKPFTLPELYAMVSRIAEAA
ncbi:MAG: hypothetical protein QOF51_3189 [Chloroflexota bacterium]|nr:hypothetical protein [Chloroflexota bacterium]